LDVLLRTASGSDINLKIAGDGPERDRLKFQVTSYKLQKKVEFVGHKSGRELHDLIRGSRFVVLPAVWYENYPMSLIEANALGKAAVGTNLGGIREIIQDGENGLLASSNDAKDLRNKIDQLWGNPGLCERMGRLAREMVIGKNSSEEHYQKIIGLYESAKKQLTTNN
jgi:glycosyltransferase involved in cell wall biosynthesis